MNLQANQPNRTARSEHRTAVADWRHGTPTPLPIRRTALKRSRLNRFARWARRQHDSNNLLWAFILVAFAIGYVLTLTRFFSA